MAKIYIMSKTSEQIQKYVDMEIRSGRLRPGGRLPSFREMAEKFGVTYLTVRNAVQQLERDQIVEIKQHGTFLAGGDALKVLVRCIPTTISKENMRQLLVKYLANSDLNVEIEVSSIRKITRNVSAREDFQHDYDAVISFTAYMNDFCNSFPSTRLNLLPGTEKIKSKLLDLGNLDLTYQIPFSIFTYQMGMNRRLMRKIGFDPAKITGDFKWWEGYVRKCRTQGMVPASICMPPSDIHLFSKLIHPMLSILPYDEKKYRNPGPLFKSEAGFRFLQLVHDTEIYFQDNDERLFLRNGCPFSFSIGSWITVQNQDPSRRDVKVDELVIIPFRTENGRKICFNTFECLEVYLSPFATAEKRDRIGKLIALMYSHDFQKEYCSQTGTISVRQDVCPTEYYWNRTLEWNDFIPSPDDLFVFPFILFDSDLQVAWSILLENMKFFHADFSETATRMDLKKR